MKPIVILPPETMSAEDIQLLRDNDLCVVVSADPSKVHFLDPIPAQVGRTAIEDAAIRLSRRILDRQTFGSSGTIDRAAVARMYVDILVKGTPLDANPTKQEQEQEVFDVAKFEELRRLAREEAKQERAAAKTAKAAEKKEPAR